VKRLRQAVIFAMEAKYAKNRCIRFMAFLFGTYGFHNYGNGFWPAGYWWCGWFARATPWPQGRPWRHEEQ
jgi:hypothetical protein